MKYIDYHYKQSALEYKDELERQRFELTNEYGYNFDCETKRYINDESLFMHPKNLVNKDFINLKR